MSGSKYSFKDDARKQIIEASEILKRKAIEITNDLDDEKVNEILLMFQNHQHSTFRKHIFQLTRRIMNDCKISELRIVRI